MATAPVRGSMARRLPAGAGVTGLACAAAVVLVGSLWFGPLVPLGVLAVVAAVVLAVRAPALLVGLTLLIIVFSTPLVSLLGSALGSLDDALVAFCAMALTVRRLVTTGRVVLLPGAAWFAGFFLFGVLSGVVQAVPSTTLVQGTLVAVKGLLFAHAVAQVSWSRAHVDRALRAGVVLIVLIVLAGAVNLLAPAAWTSLLGITPARGVGGLPALTGIFPRPGAFSRFCGVLAIAALAYQLVVARTALGLAAFVACTALAFLTLQVKSVIGLIATITLCCLPFVTRRRALTALAFLPTLALVLAPPLAVLISADIESYVLQESARSLLTEGGASVAQQTFPLGAGFGRFGSSTAVADYSPWYYRLGFDTRFGMGPGPESGQFLNDTQWPAIYAETGWLGAVCFALGVLAMLVFLVRGFHAEREPLLRWVALAGAGWTVLLLAESVAAPVFVSAPSYPFFFLAPAVLAALRIRRSAGTGPELPAAVASDRR